MAQTDLEVGQVQFQNGKSLYEEGKYGLARETLKSLMTPGKNNVYSEFASFYYGLSAWHEGFSALARETMMAIRNNNPGWQHIDEVNYWLAVINLHEGDYTRGLSELQRVSNKQLKGIITDTKKYFIQQLDSIDSVQILHEVFPGDSVVGERLADLIAAKPYRERDMPLLRELIATYGLDAGKYGAITRENNPLKEEYHVGILFPFLLERLYPDLKPKVNGFILDLYQGISLATDSLNQLGSALHLHLFDTYRNRDSTRTILQSGELNNMDLIIGPVFNSNSDLAYEFAVENRINVVHPLTKNEELIKDNPFNFLYSQLAYPVGPSAANYVLSDSTNKHGMIFYGENTSDSLIVSSFREAVEKDSVQIVSIRKIYKEHERDILLTLVDEAVVNKMEVDSLTLGRDSVDFIFVASSGRGGAIYSNVLTAVETRPDTIEVIGSYHWPDDNVIDMKTFDNLGVRWCAPDAFDVYSKKFKVFEKKYIKRYGVYPSKHAIIGYDLMFYFGTQLQESGKYFQLDLGIKGTVAGQLSPGLNYANTQYNAYVPVMGWDGNKLVIFDPKTKNNEQDSNEY